MSHGKRSKSIWHRSDKSKSETKKDESEKLFYRINKRTGRTETNLLEWERSWKNVKILKYPSRYGEELRSGVRNLGNGEEELAELQILPELDVAREFWRPTPEQVEILAGINPRVRKDAARDDMYFAWRAPRVEENARIKRLNEMTKTRLDLAVKDQRERKDTIGKIMGAVLEDMTKSSRERIEKFRRELEDEGDEGTRTLEEARERGDWLFIFEAARKTHIDNVGTDDGVLMFQRRDTEREYLAKMKHVSGDFNRWITKFEDQVETCETIGLELDEDAKIFYFMNNLNDEIFRESKAAFMNLSTRRLYPDNYEDIKQRMIDEYGQMMARKPQLVLKVIKGEDSKRREESSFKAGEEHKSSDKCRRQRCSAAEACCSKLRPMLGGRGHAADVRPWCRSSMHYAAGRSRGRCAAAGVPQ